MSKALMVIDEMKLSKIKPGLIVYTCLIQTCIKSHQLKNAIGLFKDMKD